MKEQKLNLQFEVKGAQELATKINKVMTLLKEANAILNNVAGDTQIEIVVKDSNQI